MPDVNEVCKTAESRETQIKTHENVAKLDGEQIKQNWREKLKIADAYVEYKEECLRKMADLGSIWDGRPGRIAVAEHRIKFYPAESKPIHSWTNRAGSKAHKFETNKIGALLSGGGIKPSQNKWAAPIVFGTMRDGFLRFCVVYGKFNAVAKPDVHPIPCLEECIDLYGNAFVLLTIPKNSGY